MLFISSFGQIGLHETKKFFTAKKNINKIKRQPTEWENIFVDTSDKGLMGYEVEGWSKKEKWTWATVQWLWVGVGCKGTKW